jgi:hypothetical protein
MTAPNHGRQRPTLEHTVALAVQRAGRAAPSFGLGEVRAELDVLHRESRPTAVTLRRHLQQLVGAVMVPVPTGVEAVAEPEETTTADRTRNGRRYRLLTSVVPADPHTQLDDAARVLLALYIAAGITGTLSVPTVLVTRVLTADPQLALRSQQQTATVLNALAVRYPQVVSKERGDGRSQLWGAVGVLRPEWIAWVMERAAALEGQLVRDRRVAEAGAASGTQLVARVVELVERRVRDQQWPNGRPVSARRILEEIDAARASLVPTADDDALVRFSDAVLHKFRDITEALQSACRTTFSHGARRRAPLVLRMRISDERSTCYASASLDPHIVEAWRLWRLAQSSCSRDAHSRLARERLLTRGLAQAGDPVLVAISAARVVLAVDELTRMQERLAALRPMAHEISAALEASRRALHTRVEHEVRQWPIRRAAEDAARAALKPLGLTLPVLRGTPRPALTLARFAELAPAGLRRHLSAGVLAANAVTVRKTESPEGRRSGVGQGRTPRYHLDRPDALLYLAENGGMVGHRMLLAGSRLLGPWLAVPGLMQRALDHASPDVRSAALGALLLLGERARVDAECRRRERRIQELGVLERENLRAARWWLQVLTPGAS